MKTTTTKRLCLLAGILFLRVSSASGQSVCDWAWGGSNEETAYSQPYIRSLNRVSLDEVASPKTNLGAPERAIPVQPSPSVPGAVIPQATIPTITIPQGPVGSPGQPATSPLGTTLPQAPPGSEIVYVLPVEKPEGETTQCIDGVQRTPARSTRIVPPGTPGAIPVAVKTMTVVRPKVEYHWSYSPIRTKTETTVNVVDPRTGRVVRTYCKEDEDKSLLPWPHRKEVVTYETITAKVGIPVSLPQPTSSNAHTAIQGHSVPGSSIPGDGYRVNYPDFSIPSMSEPAFHRTIINP